MIRPNPKSMLLTAAGTLVALLVYSQGDALAQEPILWTLVLVECLVFGLGVAFVFEGRRPMMAALPDDRPRARLAYLGTAWILTSWMFYDTLTLHFGHRVLDLVFDAHVYHATLVAAGLAVARYVVALMERGAVAARAGAPAA